MRAVQLALWALGMGAALSCFIRLTTDGWALIAAAALAAVLLIEHRTHHHADETLDADRQETSA